MRIPRNRPQSHYVVSCARTSSHLSSCIELLTARVRITALPVESELICTDFHALAPATPLHSCRASTSPPPATSATLQLHHIRNERNYAE